MKDVKQRKEVNLNKETLKKLQKKADKNKRKLKPYMEIILEKHANLPDDYDLLSV